jgi:hypothetical protein
LRGKRWRQRALLTRVAWSRRRYHTGALTAEHRGNSCPPFWHCAVSLRRDRDAQPVANVQPQDAYSDCSMINAEIQANNSRAQALASEQNAKVVQNVAAGVVGIVV